MQETPSNKHVLDSMLLKIPGVVAAEMSGFPAYFINKRMFACICGSGVGIRLPVTDATNLQFSRNDVGPFQPNGKPSTREWIQITHADSDAYVKDLDIFQASIAFVAKSK